MFKVIFGIVYFVIGLCITIFTTGIYFVNKKEMIERLGCSCDTHLSDLSFILIASYICVSALILWPVVVTFVISIIYDTTFPPKSEKPEEGTKESE
jgi:hypothetical protein